MKKEGNMWMNKEDQLANDSRAGPPGALGPWPWPAWGGRARLVSSIPGPLSEPGVVQPEEVTRELGRAALGQRGVNRSLLGANTAFLKGQADQHIKNYL